MLLLLMLHKSPISSAKLVSNTSSIQALHRQRSYSSRSACGKSETLFQKEKNRGNDSIYLESTRPWFKPQDHKTSNHILLKGICCFVFPPYTVSIINCGVLSYYFLSSNTKKIFDICIKQIINILKELNSDRK